MKRFNLEFVVQIMVAKFTLSAVDLNKMGKLGNIDKQLRVPICIGILQEHINH